MQQQTQLIEGLLNMIHVIAEDSKVAEGMLTIKFGQA